MRRSGLSLGDIIISDPPVAPGLTRAPDTLTVSRRSGGHRSLLGGLINQYALLHELIEAGLHGQIPGKPQRMIVRRREGRVAHRGAVEGAQYPVGKQKVAEHTGHDEVLTEQPLEERAGQHLPRDGVRDGREDPVQLSEGGLPVVDLAGDGIDPFRVDAGPAQRVAVDEPPERYGYRRREAAGEEVGGELGPHREQIARRCRAEDDDVPHSPGGVGGLCLPRHSADPTRRRRASSSIHSVRGIAKRPPLL